MNCVWFEMRLDELLDERLPIDGDAEVNDHAETCPRCAQVLADHQAMLEAIQLLDRPETGRNLAARILAEVAKEPVSLAASFSPAAAVVQPVDAARRTPLRAAAWIAAAVAATLLVGVGLMERSNARHAAAVAAVKIPDINVPKMAVENAAVSPAADYRDRVGTRSLAAVQMPTDLIGHQRRSLMEQMTDGLKPVTRSMSAALNALRRTLPGSETPARSS